MIKTQAIVLKAADLRETDQLLTIYSKEFGKIRVAARGIKKSESKSRYHLEPLSYSQLILIEGKSFKIIKNAVLVDQFLSMRRDLDKMKIAFKIIELIDELIVGEEQDENIWNLLLKTLKELNIGGQVSNIVQDFQDNLVKLLGYDPKQVRNVEDIY